MTRRPRELVQLLASWTGDTPDGGIWAEEKRDGIRAAYIDGSLYTREGVDIHGTNHIRQVLADLEARAGMRLFIDGEYQVGDTLQATLSHFGRGAAADDAGTLWAFDMLPLDDWRADNSETPLVERKAALVKLMGEMRQAPEPWDWPERSRGKQPPADSVIVMPDLWLPDAAAVWDEARRVWARGGEGLVLKDWSAPYRRTRSRAWMKLKPDGYATRKVAHKAIEGMRR